MSLSYLTYEEINKVKWDRCIERSANGLVYARSFYLDAMAEHWDAIVLNDYEAVMPLPWKMKWKISYLYQPPFIQQGGIFSTKALSGNLLQEFIELAIKHFKFAEITLNFANDAAPVTHLLQNEARTNYILDLNRTYQQLYDNYDPAFTKSLRRLRKFAIRYEHGNEFRDTIALYKELYGKRLPFFPAAAYENFEKVCRRMQGENNVIVRHARSQDNVLLASVVLLKDAHRLYNIISCITEAGKKLEANYFLYDSILQEFAGGDLLLDFEGSDVKGIAAFYKKFNPKIQAYPFVRFNNLPAIVKVFKR